MLSLDNISKNGRELLASVDSFKSEANRENNAEGVLKAIDSTAYQTNRDIFQVVKKEDLQNSLFTTEIVNFYDPGYDSDNDLESTEELNTSFF